MARFIDRVVLHLQAAVWTAQRFKLFTVHRRAAVASVAGLQGEYASYL